MAIEGEHRAVVPMPMADQISVVTRRDSAWRRLLRTLYAQPASTFGTTMELLFVVIALLGPLIAPYSATEQSASEDALRAALAHLFGTDRLGRDVFSRVLLGARDILGRAGLGSVLAVLVGTFVGLMSGYRGGLLDEVLFRITQLLPGDVARVILGREASAESLERLRADTATSVHIPAVAGEFVDSSRCWLCRGPADADLAGADGHIGAAGVCSAADAR